MRLSHFWMAICLTIPGLFLAPAVGQDRGRSDDRDRDNDRGRSEDRGGDDRRREEERRKEEERRREEERNRSFDVGDVLRSADDNRNGTIEPDEIDGRSGSYIRRAAERAGLDLSRGVSIDRIRPALEQLRTAGSSAASATGPQAFGAPAAAAAPGATVPGFDVPLSAAGGLPAEQRYDRRVIDYVNDNMLRERDANKNGVLEKNEWTGSWSTPPADSDTNKDGILSKEELYARIAKRFGIGAPGSSTSSAPGSSSSSPGSGSSSPGDSGRFRQYAESLIKQNDKNNSGMLERT